MIESIMSESKNGEILKLIYSGNFNKVIKLTNNKIPIIKRLLHFKGETVGNINFANNILNACLRGRLKPNSYTKIQELRFKHDFIDELSELVRAMLVLEIYKEAPGYERVLALTILECVTNGATYIENNTDDYPQNPVNGKIWIEGAALRTRAEELAHYYKRKNDDNNELQSLFLKGKITNTIMNHYPNLVGPDMIAIANKLEQVGNTDKAKQFYSSVEADFTEFVSELEDDIEEGEYDISNEDIVIVQSLIYALEGLDRLNEDINQDKLFRAKHTLMKLEEMLSA